MRSITLKALNKKLNNLIIEVQTLRNALGLQKTPAEIDNEQVKIIVDSIEEYFEIPIGSIISPTQQGPIVEARQISMFLSFYTTELGVEKVGELFLRHHSTVSYSIKEVRKHAEVEKDYKHTLIKIGELLNLSGETINEYLTGAKN
jgi:chromosomal replication initiation ATPase DnaA